MLSMFAAIVVIFVSGLVVTETPVPASMIPYFAVSLPSAVVSIVLLSMFSFKLVEFVISKGLSTVNADLSLPVPTSLTIVTPSYAILILLAASICKGSPVLVNNLYDINFPSEETLIVSLSTFAEINCFVPSVSFGAMLTPAPAVNNCFNDNFFRLVVASVIS